MGSKYIPPAYHAGTPATLGALVVAAAALATGVSEADKAAAARSAAVAALGPTVTWTKRTSAGKKAWRGVTSDATGLRLAAGVDGGRIHTSTNGGESWTEQQGSLIKEWAFLDSSDDGSRLVSATTNGPMILSSDLFVSSNGGVLWEPSTHVTDRFKGATCDRTCKTIATGMLTLPLTYLGPYVSFDGGNAWQYASDTTAPSFTVMSKDTGPDNWPVAMIGVHNSDPASVLNTIMVKRGSGVWTTALNLNTDEAHGFNFPAVNADGRAMLVSTVGLVGKAGVFYVSTNRGGSWAKHAIVPEGGVGAGDKVLSPSNSVATSHSGKTLAVTYYVKAADNSRKNPGFLVSLDGGVSWAKQPLDVPDDVAILSVAVSGDGTRIVVTAGGDYIYTGVVNPLPGPAGSDWLAWEYQTAMGVALGATAAGVPIGTAALREK